MQAAVAALLALATLSLSACANPYADTPLAVGAADASLQEIARRARRGDKHAQLELGIRYEEGRGVRADLDRARQYYRQAASSSGGTFYIYSPPVGRTPGRVIPVTRPHAPGLAEARLRLERLGNGR
jgi:hypothetical protein